MAVVSGHHTPRETVEAAGWMADYNNSVSAVSWATESEERKHNTTCVQLCDSCVSITIRCEDTTNSKDVAIRCHDAEIVIFIPCKDMMICDNQSVIREDPAGRHSAEVPFTTAVALINRSDNDNCRHHTLIERLFCGSC
jgi:hypothetical protein